MTPKDQVDSLVALLTHRNAVAAGHIEVNNPMLKSLCEDAAALRELVEALPKCHHFDVERCASVALKEESGGMCDDFNLRYWCEEHAPGEVTDTNWADIVLRLGL